MCIRGVVLWGVSIMFSVTHYTREAGVRELERVLGAVCRAAAIKV